MFSRMLASSRALNPTCEHIEGDMRDVRLDRLFDRAVDALKGEASPKPMLGAA